MIASLDTPAAPPAVVWKVSASRQSIEIRGSLPASSKVAEISVDERAPNDPPDAPSRSPATRFAIRDRKFRLVLPRFDESRDRIYSAFRPAAAGVDFGPSRFVESMDAAAERDFPFPLVRSKKGLQVQMVDDAIALGVRHAALNVDLTALVDLDGDPNSVLRPMDGRDYRFRRSTVIALDSQVKPLSDAGMIVTFILLAYADASRPDVTRLMLHPDYDPAAPNRLGAFNTVTDAGLAWFKACIEFLVERYTRPDRKYGRAVNYIVGNEVNSHHWWANQGPKTMEAFADDYLRTLRVCTTAARKIYRRARVYVSLEHHWNIRYGDDPMKSFPGRPFLERLARESKARGDFPWHVAFHPYPENLFEPATWNDASAWPTDNTPRITFKNLEVLPRFLDRPDLRFAGKPRRILLSEQGFHTKDGLEGEKLQAEAYLYAWRKAATLPTIDAFILHRHVDHKAEGGLKLGLWTWDEKSLSPSAPGRKKLLWEVFRDVDRKP